ncbi:pentatricopeptide repeat-containing protein At1g09900 [Selaginella moellendorffii]|nr:pentatricopeptide repeat-containing protein At1g09900 [Selaginella moellendorffii]|eukprot:XP_002972521.2 pentatricopeptide repeat-containing protein At1g09900 [Selaginella moellendorffii]
MQVAAFFLGRKWRWEEAYRFSSARCLAAFCGSQLVETAVAGLDRAIQARGKKAAYNWAKDPIRPEMVDAEAIVAAVKAGRLDKRLVSHLRDSTRIACLVLSHLVLPDQAVSFFVWAARQDGFKHDITSANQLLETLVRCGRSMDAYGIFKRFSRMFKPNAFTYTVLVRGLCDAGRIDEACEVFNEMQGRGGIEAKTAIYSVLLNGLLRSGKLDDAFSYYQMMQETCQPDSSTYSTMIYELSRQGRLDHATKVAQEMVDKDKIPDMPCLGVALEILCRCGRVSDAWKLLRMMKEKHFKPDAVPHTYVLRKFCEAGRLDEALKGFEEMTGNEKCEPDFVTYSVIMDGLCSAQRLDDAWKFMEKMVAKGRMPDVRTFRSLVESHSKPRLVEDRGKLEDGKRAKPTATMYTLLLYGLLRKGRAGEAMELYQQVLSGSTRPSFLTYWVIIDGLGKAGRGLEADEVFSDMIRGDVSPQTVTYNALISGLCRIGCVERALELFREMPQRECRPDSASYGALLDGICKAERADDAVTLLREASESGVEIDVAVHEAVVAMLKSTGRVSEAENVTARMETRE